MRSPLICVRSSNASESRSIEPFEELGVVSRRLHFEWQLLATESAVEITSEPYAVRACDARDMHGVRNAIGKRRASAVGKKSSVQVQSDPAIAVAKCRDLRVGEMSFVRIEERLCIRMGCDHASRSRCEHILKGRA